MEEEREYNKYCGDKDLWKKYSKGQVFYKGKANGESDDISSIYRDNGGISINLRSSGSFPLCSNIRNNKVSILNGYKCDEIILT